MKTIITFAFLCLSMTISGQQEVLGTLTPGMVSQTSANKNLQGDNDLTRARKIFLAGGTKFPRGIQLRYTLKKRIVSFKKTHSRLDKTDGSYILPAGSPVFLVPGESMPRYPYCLNIFSSFAVLPVEVEYVEVEAKNNDNKDIVINNNVYLKREEGLDVGNNVGGRVVRGSFREVSQPHPSNINTTSSQVAPSQQYSCDSALAEYYQILMTYNTGPMTGNGKRKAERKLAELKMQYPNCLNGVTIDRAKKGVRWVENNAIDIAHLTYDILNDRNNNYISNITNVTNNHGNGDYNPGNNNSTGGNNQGGYNPGNGNYNPGGGNTSGYNARAQNVVAQTGGQFGSFIK